MPEVSGRYATRSASGVAPPRRVNYADASDSSGDEAPRVVPKMVDMRVPEPQPTETRKFRGRAHLTAHMYFKNDDLRREADESSVPLLVPIRLELEHENYRVREAFTWNLNERLYSIEHYARILCDDLELPVQIFLQLIVESIHQQIEEYRSYLPFFVQDNSAERIPMALDINVGRYYLRDRFEWDLTSPLSPEVFAQNLCADLHLSGELYRALHSAFESNYFNIKNCV